MSKTSELLTKTKSEKSALTDHLIFDLLKENEGQDADKAYSSHAISLIPQDSKVAEVTTISKQIVEEDSDDTSSDEGVVSVVDQRFFKIPPWIGPSEDSFKQEEKEVVSDRFRSVSDPEEYTHLSLPIPEPEESYLLWLLGTDVDEEYAPLPPLKRETTSDYDTIGDSFFPQEEEYTQIEL